MHFCDMLLETKLSVVCRHNSGSSLVSETIRKSGELSLKTLKITRKSGSLKIKYEETRAGSRL